MWSWMENALWITCNGILQVFITAQWMCTCSSTLLCAIIWAFVDPLLLTHCYLLQQVTLSNSIDPVPVSYSCTVLFALCHNTQQSSCKTVLFPAFAICHLEVNDIISKWLCVDKVYRVLLYCMGLTMCECGYIHIVCIWANYCIQSISYTRVVLGSKCN